MKLRMALGRLNGRVVVSGAAMFFLSSGVFAQTQPPKPSAAAAVDSPSAGAKRAGQDVPVPSRKKYVAPEYPAEAAAQGIRGIVILDVEIGEDGRVESAKVTRSIPGLDEAAIAAVKLWEYEPTKLAGKPVRVQLAQSITFSLKLPDLQRAPGVPELKSGGTPPVPPSLATAEKASVSLALGSQGEVREASVLEGNSVVSEALLRAVRSWRFVVSEGAVPPSFTVSAEWTPGPTPILVLKALSPKTTEAMAAATSPAPADGPKPTVAPEPPPAKPNMTVAAAPADGGSAASVPRSTDADVTTDVLPARQDPPAKEQGASAVADVILGENIPDLAKGRRPVWPPMARLGNVGGEVTVRFSVDLAGKVTVHSAEGPELLKASAEQAVGTWLFRRTAIDRVHLIATFKFGADRSMARVERQP